MNIFLPFIWFLNNSSKTMKCERTLSWMHGIVLLAFNRGDVHLRHKQRSGGGVGDGVGGQCWGYAPFIVYVTIIWEIWESRQCVLTFGGCVCPVMCIGRLCNVKAIALALDHALILSVLCKDVRFGISHITPTVFSDYRFWCIQFASEIHESYWLVIINPGWLHDD